MLMPAGMSESSEDELELESRVSGPEYNSWRRGRRPLEEQIDMTPTMTKGDTQTQETQDSCCYNGDSAPQSIRDLTPGSENGSNGMVGSGGSNGVDRRDSTHRTDSHINGNSSTLSPMWLNGCPKASSPAPSCYSQKSRSPTPFRSGSWREIRMHQGYSVPMEEFRMAAVQGNLPVIKSLMKQGIAVDQILRSGWTCLMYACSSAKPHVVQYLLDNGADPNMHKELFTSLMAACASSRDCEPDILECVESLLAKGARVNAAERHRMTPLMFASKEGRLSIVQRLLEAKADVNKQDSKGWSALSWACTRGHGRVVRLLLQHSADPNTMTSHGQRPSDVALAAGYPEISDILDRFSAGGCITDIMPSPSLDSLSSRNSSRASSESRRSTHQLFGELEMVLCGLDLSYMIPLFQEHKVSFEAFLRLSEKDLEAVGVTAVGVRKKLLQAIKEIHKKEWETSSLPNPAAKDFQITVPEATALVGNINKHLRYIHASIGYMRDQLEADPKLLQLGLEQHSVASLANQCGDSLKYLQALHEEVKFFKCHLDKVSGNAEYASADLIVERTDSGRAWQRRLLASLATTTAIATVLWFSRPKVFARIFNLPLSQDSVMLDI